VGSRVALLTVIGVLTLVAGCTNREPGSATADPGSAPTSGSSESGEAPSGSAKPTVDIPPRPRDLPLDGLDPCKLFTPDQVAALKADDVKTQTSEAKAYKGMQECALDVDSQEPFVTYSALAATNEDLSVWLTGNRNVEAKLISVGGYPAAQFNTLGVTTDCVIAVGVADGQHLQVEMTPWSDGFTQDEICQASKQAAEMALQTLQTLK